MKHLIIGQLQKPAKFSAFHWSTSRSQAFIGQLLGTSRVVHLPKRTVGWLVGCFGFNGPLRQYFSLYRAVSQREGDKRRERIDESKNVQTTPTRTYCKRSRPLPYYHSNCRTPQHWKFTQHHRTTRPPLETNRNGLIHHIGCLITLSDRNGPNHQIGQGYVGHA